MTKPTCHFDALTQPLTGFYSIEASAGTGKTFSITVLWLRLLIEKRLRVDQILVTTFTRSATAELRERLLMSLRRALLFAKADNRRTDIVEAQIVSNALSLLERDVLIKDLQTALSCFDLAPIHTIHGFCQSLISRHCLELGCDPAMELVDDASDFLEEIVDDRLMRNANDFQLDRANALQVARVAVMNPLARIVDPVNRAEVLAECQALVGPLLEQIDQLNIPSRSRDPIVRNVLDARDTGTFVRFTPAQSRHLEPILAKLNAALGRMRRLHRALDVSALHSIAGMARDEFPRRKTHASVRTFDDILTTVHQALLIDAGESTVERAIRERFRAAIVDECQDSDSCQIAVFQRLFSQAESFLVIGDPKQSIYRFRGADLCSYQHLIEKARHAPDMTINYRSDRPLVEALNRLYLKQPNFHGRTPNRTVRYVPVDSPVTQTRLHDPQCGEPLLLLWSDQSDRMIAKRDLARQTALEFRRLLNDGVSVVDRETNAPRQVRASDLAVLATTHRDLVIVRYELSRAGIPSELAGPSLGSIWDSDEAADVQAWLEALVSMLEHNNPLAFMLALGATPLFAWTTDELDRFRIDAVAHAVLAQRLFDDAEQLRRQGPLPVLQRYWQDLERIQVRIGSRDGERRVTNWRQIGCLLQLQWARGKSQAGELRLWLARQRGRIGDAAADSMMRLETDLPAVQLATIFGAKGLEYPIVACPFLWHKRSRVAREHSPTAVVQQGEGSLIDVGSADFCQHLDESIAQEDDELERLLYVALTRARHRVYVGLAPVTAGGQHDNGAERSALVALLGLESVEKQHWRLQSPLPICHLSQPTPPMQALGRLGATKVNLGIPPTVALQRGPLTRCSSYSALTRNEEIAARDHDPMDRSEGAKLPGLLGELNLTGNRLGQRVHRLLEDIVGNGQLLEQVTQNLEPTWKPALSAILSTPLRLGTHAVTLSQIQPRAIAEMHVLLPVDTITPARLAEALLSDPLILATPERRAWAADIANWSFSALTGYFQGYIDLIFEHEGRFYVVDYKTNMLPSYGPVALEAAMLEHHYLLQARLYMVAVHRHLGRTMPGYDPALHFGGCAYLFLRGFPDQGLWYEPMQPASLDAINALFAQAQP